MEITTSYLKQQEMVNELNSLYNKMNNTNKDHFNYIIKDNKQYLFLDYNLLWSSDDLLPLNIVVTYIERNMKNIIKEFGIQN